MVRLCRITRRREAQEGLTLLELSIASGIMAAAFVLVVGALIGVSATNTFTQERTIATGQLTTVLEELHGSTFDQVLAYQPPGVQGLGGVVTSVVCLDSNGNLVPLPIVSGAVADALPNPVEVQVRVTWRDLAGRMQTCTASTLIGR